MKRPTIAACALMFAALIPATSHAYRLIQQTGGPGTFTAGDRVAPGSGVTVHWTQRALDFRVNTTGAGDALTFAQTQTAVSAAFAAWHDLSCTAISFRRQAGTTSRRNATDGNNTVYWAETGAPEYTGATQILGPGTLAVTIITLRADQSLTDVDIAFNGRDFAWTIGDTAVSRDVQDTATHEIGHLIGLHHTESNAAPTPTMFAFDQPGNGGRTLEPDDINAACYVYPLLAGASSETMGDFNGDAYADLAIGVPNESIGSIGQAGAVSVIYGSAAGTTSAGNQLWHQDSSGVRGGSETDDHFGSAVASGDFNRDGYDDLAIGVRNEAIGTTLGAGAVNVLYGSSSGLRATGNQLWHQDVSLVLGGAETGDQFGSALATGDFNRDGFDDLAIGVPNESIGAIAGAGAVSILFGSGSGLIANGNQLWHQDSSGINGGSEVNDHFGTALSAADYNGDGFADLAIGVRNESIGAIERAGAVNMIPGSPSGLTFIGNQIWHQNSANIDGGSEADDGFGSALTSGLFNGDRFADLAIGVPKESIGSIPAAGAVNVIHGSAGGLTSNGDQIWHQNVTGIEGGSEANDAFGSALSAGDYNADGRSDLAIGVPVESIGSIRGAGAVNVIYGSAAGLRANGDQILHQDRVGIAGGCEADDAFGSALVSGLVRSKSRPAALAIGVRNEAIGAVAGAGAVNLIYGSAAGLAAAGNQMWQQDTSGIAGGAENNDNFGASL